MEFTLQNRDLRLGVSARGAEMQSLTAFGTEYLWGGDPAFWADRSPLLFPFVGRLYGGKYRLNAREHSMDIHGFAKDQVFAVESQKKDSLTLLLEDNAETFAQYPFSFELRVSYLLEGLCVKVEYAVKNRSDGEMMFGIGGHPGFRLPLEEGRQFTDYSLEFSPAHHPDRVGFTSNCFLSGENRPLLLEEGKRLRLRHDMFDQDAVVLANVARELRLSAEGGRRGLKMRYHSMPYLGIWHRPKTRAPYVCLEPWSSLPARQSITEDLGCKSDLTRLPPGESWKGGWEVELF